MNAQLQNISATPCLADLLALLPELRPEDMPAGLLRTPINDLVTDSRRVAAGDVFLAVKTPFADGSPYVEYALAQGAVCCLIDAELVTDDLPVSPLRARQVIAVAGLSVQLAELARRFYADPSSQVPVVGITGTNGKSSCVHFLAQLAGRIWGTPGGMVGTLGWGTPDDLNAATHTTPDAVNLQRQLHELVLQDVSLTAIEVSSHALLQQRSAGTRLAVAAFTNLSQDHLDYHGDMQAYAAAKKRLFSDHQISGAVVGVDDQYGAQLADSLRQDLAPGIQLLTTSAAPGQADVCVTLEQSAEHEAMHGLRIRITSPWGSATVQTQLLGAFNAANLATCIACLGALNAPFNSMVAALRTVRPVPGRMQQVISANRASQVRQPCVIVDYAHTPDALDKALRSCRLHTAARLYCVFGCGGDRDKDKRPKMGAIAEQLADQLVITSDNPRNEDPGAILADISRGLEHPARAHQEVDRGRAIDWAIRQAQAGDCVLIAGKGHERSQQIGDLKLPFDDVLVATQALEQAA